MKGKILIVDDEKDFREMLKLALQSDYQISEADSGAELQKAFVRDQPDVVLLDVRLPDANGLELLPGLKKRSPEAQVIIQADTGVNHGRVVEVMEAAKSVGISRLAIATEAQ